MKNTILKTSAFIDQQAFRVAVNHLLDAAHAAKKKAQGNYDRNVIDPFSALFEMAGFESDLETWKASERNRQAQKTLQNSVGEFHQNLLGAVYGWKNLGRGEIIDLVCADIKIIAEVKNKYNTVKGSDQVNTYDHLHSQVMDKGQKYKGYTAYYVQVIPKSGARYDIPFTPPVNKTGQKKPINEKIRVIDGHSFYSLVSGVENALDLVFEDLYVLVRDALQVSKSNYKLISKTDLDAFFKKAFYPKQP